MPGEAEFVNVSEWWVLAGRLRGFVTPLGAVVEAEHFEDPDCAALWSYLCEMAPEDSVADLYERAGLFGREPLSARAAVLAGQLTRCDVTFERFADAAWELVRGDRGDEPDLSAVTASKAPLPLEQLSLEGYARQVRLCSVRRRAPFRF